MGENNKFDCWGLSLSLKPPITNPHHHPISTPTEITDKQIPNLEKPKSTSTMLMSKIIGVDIKPIPLVIDLEKVEETAKNFSPNSSLLSSATGNKKLCGRNMINVEDGGSNGGSSGGPGGREERKKLRLSKEQIMVLEQAFREHMTLNTKQKIALARQVNLRPRQIEVWFQNRRARIKLKQTEVECEQLRRFCETLTQENRKLHKEVQQLRTLKTSSGLTQQATDPPSTLTICPSCKTISTTAKTSTTDAGPRPVGMFHQQVPLSLTQFSLTINSNRRFKSHLSQA